MGEHPHDQRPKVLCLAGWWPEGRDLNGVFVREHVIAVSRFCDVQVVHIELVKKPGFPRIHVRTNIEDGFPVHRIRIETPLRRFGVERALVRRAYEKILLRTKFIPDICHVHVRTWITEQILHVKNIVDIPIVITEHSSFYHTGILQLPEKRQIEMRSHISKWFRSPRIKAVMPVSQSLARNLSTGFGVAGSKVVVIPNVASPFFKRSNIRRDPPPFNIVLIAQWRPPKDPFTFIEAIKLLEPDTRKKIRIIWGGEGPAMPEIREQVNEKIPDVNIEFPGLLAKKDIARYMQGAHLFVLPTTAENLPCVILESLSCGTPVVSMAVNGIPEMVDERNGTLVAPKDPMALSQAIAQMISKYPMLDHDEIADRAQARYSMESVGRSITDVYVAVLGDRALVPVGVKKDR